MSSVIVETPVPSVINVEVTAPAGEGMPVEVEVLNGDPAVVEVQVMAPDFSGYVTPGQLAAAMQTVLNSAKFYTDGELSQKLFQESYETFAEVNPTGPLALIAVSADEGGDGTESFFFRFGNKLFSLVAPEI